MTKVADQILAQYIKFQHDMLERVLKGSIDPIELMNVQRPLIGQKPSLEGKTFKKSEFFISGNNKKTKLLLSDNFKNFLKLSSEELDIVKLPEYITLSEPMDHFDIRKKYGEAIIKTPKQILEEMYTLINSGSKILADGSMNIWYYLDEPGNLHSVYCDWDTIRAQWNYGERIAGTDNWNVDSRVFVPYTYV